MSIIQSINRLPLELTYGIRDYIPLKFTFNTNHIYYDSYKRGKYHSSESNLSMEYLRKLIRNDFNFIFGIVVSVKFNSWYKPWKIRYKDYTFPCLIDLLDYFCIEYK